MNEKTANDQNFTLGEFIAGMAESNARLVRVGMQAADDRYRGAIRALDAGYKAAALDPEAKIPTYLTAAIHVLLTIRPAVTVDDYAETMIKRDQLARHEGRPDDDMSASHGTPLKEGS